MDASFSNAQEVEKTQSVKTTIFNFMNVLSVLSSLLVCGCEREPEEVEKLLEVIRVEDPYVQILLGWKTLTSKYY